MAKKTGSEALTRGHVDPRPLKEMPLGEAGPDRFGKLDCKGRSAKVNLAESPLSWLFARGHISERQFEAGEALRRDYERASLGPCVTMRYDAAPLQRGRRGPADHMNASETQLAIKQRFDGAMHEVGHGLSDICWRVICAGEAMAVAEKGLGWPVRSGKLVLILALDRLADFYRIPGA